MSKEQPEVVDAGAGYDAVEVRSVTCTNGAYKPSPSDLRHTALHMAISIKPPGHTKAASVVEDAQAFEAYLKGEGQ